MCRPGARHAVTAAAVGVFLAWFLLLRPSFLGGPVSWVRVTGVSMEPALEDGDLAIVRTEDSYRRGDIVAFRVPEGEPAEGGLVIHRIVGGSAANGFVVRGDNKRAPDLWKPTEAQIVGVLWFTVPGGGRLLGRLREPPTFASLAAALAVFTVLVGGDKTRGRPRSRLVTSTVMTNTDGAVAEVCLEIEQRLRELERMYLQVGPDVAHRSRAFPSPTRSVCPGARAQRAWRPAAWRGG